jgi:cytochrome c5
VKTGILIWAAAAVMAIGAGHSWQAAERPPALERGRQLYHARCDFCHLADGSGTFMIARQLGKEKAFLEDRTDLAPEYIRGVCRAGIGAMPRYTRVDVPDGELDLIIAYLTRPRPETKKSPAVGGGKHE